MIIIVTINQIRLKILTLRSMMLRLLYPNFITKLEDSDTIALLLLLKNYSSLKILRIFTDI